MADFSERQGNESSFTENKMGVMPENKTFRDANNGIKRFKDLAEFADRFCRGTPGPHEIFVLCVQDRKEGYVQIGALFRETALCAMPPKMIVNILE
jgi:hypothetical protein